MKLNKLLVLSVCLFLNACSSDESTPIPTKTYEEDSSINTQNPDRGFYSATYDLTKDEDDMFDEVVDDENKLAYALIDLQDYTYIQTLPSTIINNIETNLQNAKDLNIKMILRISYRPSLNDKYEDPSKEIIASHLQQLTSTLQAHKDIISIVQAGAIGAWGEWHAFTGDYKEEHSDHKENRRTIIEALIDIFPDKYIQIRYPMQKEYLYGSSQEYQDEGTDAQITTEIAFTDDIRAKIGHHNDCFLATDNDNGTYTDDNIEFWTEYVVNDTKYSPVGGETCIDDDTYTNCSNALEQLKRLQWSYINESYHEDVIQRFKDEGCYQEIRENIGYRLVANALYLDQSETHLNIKLNITNEGYAAPYIKSSINFILQDMNATENIYYYEESSVDLRTFYTQATNTITSDIPLDQLVSGHEHCLYIRIGEEHSYIKLSNKSLWDEITQSNILKCNLLVN